MSAAIRLDISWTASYWSFGRGDPQWEHACKGYLLSASRGQSSNHKLVVKQDRVLEGSKEAFLKLSIRACRRAARTQQSPADVQRPIGALSLAKFNKRNA